MTHSFWWDIATPFLLAVGFPYLTLKSARDYRTSSSERPYFWVSLVLAPLQTFVWCAWLVRRDAVEPAWIAGTIAAATFAVAITLVVAERRGARVP